MTRMTSQQMPLSPEGLQGSVHIHVLDQMHFYHTEPICPEQLWEALFTVPFLGSISLATVTFHLLTK
jgi:hypothetical protein